MSIRGSRSSTEYVSVFFELPHDAVQRLGMAECDASHREIPRRIVGETDVVALQKRHLGIDVVHPERNLTQPFTQLFERRAQRRVLTDRATTGRTSHQVEADTGHLSRQGEALVGIRVAHSKICS